MTLQCGRAVVQVLVFRVDIGVMIIIESCDTPVWEVRLYIHYVIYAPNKKQQMNRQIAASEAPSLNGNSH